MNHLIKEEQIQAIEQSLGVAIPKGTRWAERINRIVAEAGLIRQKASMATIIDTPPIKPASKWEYIKNKLALRLHI